MGILPSPGMPALLSLVSLLSVLLMGCVAETGTYSVSSFEARPQGSFVESVYEGNECDFTKLFRGPVPQPYEFGRLVFTNCNYNFTKLLSYFQVDAFECKKVTPESIATGCYSSLTVDWFAYRVADKSDLLPGSSSDLQRFNYKPTYAHPTCLISAYTDLSALGGSNPTNYTLLTNCYGCVGQPPKRTCLEEFPSFVEAGYRPKPSCARIGMQGHASGNETYTAVVTNNELDSVGDPIWRMGVAQTKEPSVTDKAELAFFVSVQIDSQSSSVCPLGSPKLVPRGSSSGGSGLNDIFEAQKIEWHEGGSHHHHHHHH
uniref:Spike glycoprotein receptor binding domain n=1 Tax=Merbecovirus TaxID=2509494 RepID=UPI0039FDE1DF